uniref:Immunoglobulin V-set domain-containing protein n=1 Tax=Podarcis muralis TaxID=64176 RepID=A0A670JDH3_PODMU
MNALLFRPFVHLTPSLSVLIFCTGGNAEESVTQTEGTVTITEGDHIALNCTYTTSYSGLPLLQLSDSAVYFCALSDTVGWAGREAEQKLARGIKRWLCRKSFVGTSIAQLT